MILWEDSKHEETKPALEPVPQPNEGSTILRRCPCQSLGRTLRLQRGRKTAHCILTEDKAILQSIRSMSGQKFLINSQQDTLTDSQYDFELLALID